MIARAGENGVKASAVLAASGGLVAAFALPAHAATSGTTSATGSSKSAGTLSVTSPAGAIAAVPVAVPAKATSVSTVTVIEAPESAAPAAVATVGVSGFAAVEKPAPPPPPPVVEQAASRSATRTAIGATTPAAPAEPAPAVNVPASVGGGVLGIAAAYSGIWYVYGGSTPAGFDCSGYVQFVFGQAGISLPRTASAQMYATTRVSNPQPGDLVFFGDGNSAYHVGIYAGNGMMYDSPRTGAQSGLHSIWTTQVVYGRV